MTIDELFAQFQALQAQVNQLRSQGGGNPPAPAIAAPTTGNVGGGQIGPPSVAPGRDLSQFAPPANVQSQQQSQLSALGQTQVSPGQITSTIQQQENLRRQQEQRAQVQAQTQQLENQQRQEQEQLKQRHSQETQALTEKQQAAKDSMLRGLTAIGANQPVNRGVGRII